MVGVSRAVRTKVNLDHKFKARRLTTRDHCPKSPRTRREMRHTPIAMPEFLSHLEGAIDGAVLPAGKLANLHNGRPIWVRYHLDRVRAAVTPADIAKRPPTLWRYRELLPLPPDQEPVTLGEGMTPLLDRKSVV